MSIESRIAQILKSTDIFSDVLTQAAAYMKFFKESRSPSSASCGM